jgi:phenylalanyl-tRNA synthetase beta chain
LEAVGQRSINNVVDATNFVMFNTGQPMHAFDAGKLQQKDGKYSIAIRYARSSEQLHALDGIQYELTSSMLVIADQNNNEPIGVAGVKGGMPAAITEKTNDIILESANFNAGSVRKTAQALKLRTEASVRFEQDISPELAAYGMQSVVELIQKLAGGELAGFADAYPNPVQPWHVLVSVQNVNQVLGIILTGADIADVFQRLQFPYKEEGDVFTVVVPFERLDLTMSEDLIEEVGRIVGYDKIPALPLPPAKIAPKINQNFYRAEYTRAFLIARGFSEVYTNVFSESGERIVLNKVDGVRPYLRNALKKGLQDTLEKNIRSKELLGLSQIKIFEIGTVWRDGKELIEVTIEVEKVKGQKTQEEYKQELDVALASLPENPTHYEPIPLSTATRYQPFSKYPYIVRDIALWTPAGTNAEEVLEMIKTQAGELCVKIYLFDTFTKEGRVSLAFRLIFQSFERTLTEEEVNKIMAELSGILGDKGFEIR